jgi:hypothetical protein
MGLGSDCNARLLVQGHERSKQQIVHDKESGHMKSVRTALPLALLLVSSAAHANYACIGTVKTVTGRGETVAAIFSYAPNSWTYLCSMSAAAPNGVTPEQCKNVYAMLMAAQLAGKSVQMWYSDALTCDTQPTWAYTTGWYWGPMLVD